MKTEKLKFNKFSFLKFQFRALSIQTQRLRVIALSLSFLIFAHLYSTGTLSLDADLRYNNLNLSNHEYLLDGLGVTIRKIVGDEKGDRWILFTQVEAMENASVVDLHQATLTLKGPLGRWNLTGGKFRLPFGLLPLFSSERFLYSTSESKTVGPENDTGLQFHGSLPSFDYNLSLTKGHNLISDFPMGGLFVGRVSRTTEDNLITYSLSTALGKTEAGGHGQKGAMVKEMARNIKLGALDLSAEFPGGYLRTELVGGEIDDMLQFYYFFMADYSLHPRIEVTGSFNFLRTEKVWETLGGYVGFSFLNSYATLRAGYNFTQYIHKEKHYDHKISLQLYKLFSFTI